MAKVYFTSVQNYEDELNHKKKKAVTMKNERYHSEEQSLWEESA